MKKLRVVLSSILVAILSVATFAVPVMALDNVVDTTPLEGLIVTTPTDPSIMSGEEQSKEPVTEVEPSTGQEESSSGDEFTIPSANDGLKDDLYDGSILKENSVDLGGMLDRITVKLRELVEKVRRVCVPVLVLTWIGMFVVAALRIGTGERGASGRLIAGIFWVTFAYFGIVSAEAILYAFVNFIVGG